MFKHRTPLITGGTGSAGNAVLKRFLKTEVREIRVFSRDEEKQEDMRITYADPKLRFHIGDVREYDSVASAYSWERTAQETYGFIRDVASSRSVRCGEGSRPHA